MAKDISYQRVVYWALGLTPKNKRTPEDRPVSSHGNSLTSGRDTILYQMFDPDEGAQGFQKFGITAQVPYTRRVGRPS
jgi:hypothetical protein